MAMTIPFALGWGAVLTGVAAGVGLHNKQKAKSQAVAEAAEGKE
jgi:hypothetical protein